MTTNYTKIPGRQRRVLDTRPRPPKLKPQRAAAAGTPFQRVEIAGVEP